MIGKNTFIKTHIHGHLYPRDHHKMHVKVLAKKSTFKLDISRIESRIVKILSPTDSKHQITYRDYYINTAFQVKLVFDQFKPH